MFERLRHVSPSFVLSLLALFVALGGTAVAAGIVPRAKLADNALKLQGKTVAQLQADAPAGATGPAGPAGAAGAQGPAGPAGPPPASLLSYVTVKTASWSLTMNQGGNFSASCDPGEKAI